ncbi:unnamed protein product [Microthlaspi erraticum]|uniref:NYN domain-containing protein n=1 Tax=Microthlaspi erraticum TaxID=1685480 RepID=A0A6D2IP15_9BRAS|nr:unnamed protein product [Microthlaspi erraticum]
MAGKIEDISDGKSVQQLLREKNHLVLGDPSTLVRMGKTGVFWDAVAYPFPPGLTPDDIYEKIESALRDCDEDEDWDYMGEKSIWVYVDETDKEGPWVGDYLKSKTWTSRIYFLPGGDDKHKRVNRMLHDIHLWGMDFPVAHPRPSTLVIVSDQVRDDLFFRRMLKHFITRGFHVYLATQPGSYQPEEEVEWPASLLAVLYSFVRKGTFGSTKPHNIKKIDATRDGKDGGDKCLHIEDFSAVVEGGQLGVIWYSLPRKSEDFTCPIPSSERLPSVISNIKSAVYEMGFHNPVIIYAYGDTPDQRNLFKKAGICYAVEDEHQRSLPTDDYGEMAVDLILFATPTYEEPAILVVIANPDADSELQRVLKCLQARNHDVFVVKQPVDGSGLFDSAESIVNNTQRLVGGEHSKPNCRCRSY